MTDSELVERLGRERATAIIRCDDQEVAARAMEAAIRGGFSIVEFTLTVPGVFELVQEFSAREGLIVGAGTVLSPEDAAAAVEAGARFLVSPVVDEAVRDPRQIRPHRGGGIRPHVDAGQLGFW